MFALNLKITQMEIQIKVVKCPTKRGYSLQHNQYKGWGGTTRNDNVWSWYKYKSDALKRCNELNNYYNK
jgi:hypothetical protein